jgi:hypothetical protein
MSKPNEQYAYFTIVGDFDPEEITRVLTISPSDSWRKGDLHPRTRLERKFSRWSLKTRLPKTEPLEAQISDVLSQLDKQPEAFAKIITLYGGCMQLVGYFHELYPGLHFNSSIVESLARHHLSVDFDFYYLWSDARENTG